MVKFKCIRTRNVKFETDTDLLKVKTSESINIFHKKFLLPKKNKQLKFIRWKLRAIPVDDLIYVMFLTQCSGLYGIRAMPPICWIWLLAFYIFLTFNVFVFVFRVVYCLVCIFVIISLTFVCYLLVNLVGFAADGECIDE